MTNLFLLFLFASFITSLKLVTQKGKKTVWSSSKIMLSSSEEAELRDARVELIRCAKSYNPIDKIKIVGLRDVISTLTEKQDRDLKLLTFTRDEERKIREEKLKELESARVKEQILREQETVEAFVFIEEEKSAESYFLTRQTLYNWSNRDKELYTMNQTRVRRFEDLRNGETYFLYTIGNPDIFNTFAKVEGEVRSRDVVQSVRRGDFLFPEELFGAPFHLFNTVERMSYKVFKPYSVSGEEVKNLGFNFPVFSDDTLLIQGANWLIIESKHRVLNEDISEFQNKINYLFSNRHDPSVYQDFEPPTKIIGVIACITADFSMNLNDTNIILLVRDGDSFKVVNRS